MARRDLPDDDAAFRPAQGARSIDAAALYATHAPEIRRLCLRLTRDPSAADDLAQETFARFLARLPHLPATVNVGAYLQVTARNLYFKHLRDHTHEVCDEFLDDRLGTDEDLERDPARATLLVEQVDQMRRSAARLNGRQRRALLLREVEGQSYPEIAARMGISTDAVAHVLARARTRLRSEYRREQSPAVIATAACGPVRDVLSAYLDGQLSPDAHDAAAAHLATCDACREVLASYREASVQLRGAAPLSPVAALLERAGAIFQGGLLHTTGTAATIATGAAIVAVGGGGLVVAHHFVAPTPASSAAVATQAAPGGDPTGAGRASSPAGSTGAPGDSAVSDPAATDGGAAGVATDPGPAGTTSGAGETSTGTGTAGPTATGPIDGGSVDVTLPVDATLRVETPAVTTPRVTVPSVTTPPITTPHVATPPVATPIVTVPSVEVPAVTVPPVTTPTVALPGVTIPPVTLPKLPGH